MAETSVIKGFLVRLGFQTDEAALKNFAGGIATATTGVVKFAAAIEATALAVAVGVARFTANLESLYFASRRIGTTPSHLKAFEIAARNMGSSAEDARSALEALSQFIRSNPNASAYLGVDTTDAAGNPLDKRDVLLAEAKRLQGMPVYMAEAWNAKQGLFSENYLQTLLDPTFAQQYQHGVSAEGPDIDDAAKKAHALQVQIQDFKLQINQLALQAFRTLDKEFGVTLTTMTNWLKTHGPDIHKAMIQLHDDFVSVQNVLGPTFKWLYDTFVKLNDVTDGWAGKITLALAALKLFGGTEILSGLLKVSAALITATGPVGLIISAAAGIAYLIDNFNTQSTIGSTIADWQDRLKGMKLPLNERSNNPGALNFNRQPGASGVPLQVARFDTVEHGATALARQLEFIAGRGHDTIESIAEDYLGKNNPNLQSKIVNMKRAMGASGVGHLNLHDPVKLEKLMRAVSISEGGFLDEWGPIFDLVGRDVAGDRTIGAPRVTTNITINGAGANAQEIANRVTKAQKDVYANATRSVQSKPR